MIGEEAANMHVIGTDACRTQQKLHASVHACAFVLTLLGSCLLGRPYDASTAAAWTTTESVAAFLDSFEGAPPTGWKRKWSVTQGGGGLSTTAEVIPPRGGGSKTLRQHWDGTHMYKGMTDWLRYVFDSPLKEGDVLAFEYYLMYDANFDHYGAAVKQNILRSDEGHQEMYIHTWTYGPTGAAMTADFQQTKDFRYLPSNINGPAYEMPLGKWVHFRWEIKISTESMGNPRTGYLYGWVNGVKRWEYDNINTINSGRYTEINLNSTHNNQPGTNAPPSEGPNQKRYWDLFSVKKTTPLR
jgi:hypothetical protein